MNSPENEEDVQSQLPDDADHPESYLKLVQRFDKVMAISDKYQADTMAMANELRRSKEELERAQVTLRQSEERFRTLIENLPVGVSMIGPDLKILAANPRMKAWFPRIESQPYRPCGSADPLQPGQEKAAPSPLHKTWRDGESYTEEREVETAAGRRYMRITTAAVKGADEEVTAVIEMVEDISARQRMEVDRQEAEALERSLQKSESLHRMAGAVAHHFNNQLQSVLGNLELALRDPSVSESHRGLLNGAFTSAREAVEVSVLMRSYLGQSSLRLEPTDLSEVCRKTLTGLKKALPEKYTLQEKLPGSGPLITGNAAQIDQILTSLFTNAWEAMEKGEAGTVTVSVGSVPASAVPVAHRFPTGWQPDADATYGCLAVSDTGTGLDEKDIDKIFDPFFSEKFAGRGLGLAVLLGLMRRHAGAVTVESTPGQGSIFRCYFPVSAEAADD